MPQQAEVKGKTEGEVAHNTLLDLAGSGAFGASPGGSLDVAFGDYVRDACRALHTAAPCPRAMPPLRAHACPHRLGPTHSPPC